MQARRKVVKCMLKTERSAVTLLALLVANAIGPITHNRFNKFVRLASEVVFYRKDWRLNTSSPPSPPQDNEGEE